MREPTEESFAKDVATHQMTVILDKDEHRHLRFARPGTGNMHFYVTTWPGYLCFSGDMGCYVFARLRDMFEFFRGDRINLSYWAEKIQAADRSGVKEYDSAKLTAYVEEEIKDWPEAVREAARDEVLSHADDEHDARVALRDFDRDGHEFSDSWETNFTEYTWRFVWCCRALVWAIKQYDAARVTETAAPLATESKPDSARPPGGALVPAIGHDLTIHHVRPDEPTHTLCGMLSRGFEDEHGLRHEVDFSVGGGPVNARAEPGERAIKIREWIRDGVRKSLGDFACLGCRDVMAGWASAPPAASPPARECVEAQGAAPVAKGPTP